MEGDAFCGAASAFRQRPSNFKFDGAMAMVTRQAINSGAYLEHFESLPNLWSSERIQNFLTETMAERPEGLKDTWIFAYG